MEVSESERRRALAEEFSRLEESAMYSAQNQFEQAKQWRGVNLMLGLPASVRAPSCLGYDRFVRFGGFGIDTPD